jgi:hypothetical protein
MKSVAPVHGEAAAPPRTSAFKKLGLWNTPDVITDN